jgi:hypothetical protein
MFKKNHFVLTDTLSRIDISAFSFPNTPKSWLLTHVWSIPDSRGMARTHRAISYFSCTFLAVLFSSFVCLAFFRLSSAFLVVLVL